MVKKFKPMLAPNEQVDIESLKIEDYFVSVKLDGIRCIFKDGEMLTRSLKMIANKQLQEKFQPIKDFSKKYGIILDGEIFSPVISFQAIQSYVMSKEITSKKSQERLIEKGLEPYIPIHLKFYCFDAIRVHEGEIKCSTSFSDRCALARNSCANFPIISEWVDQDESTSKEDVMNYFENVLKGGFEGLILKRRDSFYKFGRATLNQGTMLKLKPYLTYDKKIVGILQGTEVNPEVDKSINELGRSVTSKKKEDRIYIDMASAFHVDWNGEPLKVSLSSMTHEERREVWKNRESYLGKTIEFKGMEIGAKNLPRHPVFIRVRDDK